MIYLPILLFLPFLLHLSSTLFFIYHFDILSQNIFHHKPCGGFLSFSSPFKSFSTISVKNGRLSVIVICPPKNFPQNKNLSQKTLYLSGKVFVLLYSISVCSYILCGSPFLYFYILYSIIITAVCRINRKDKKQRHPFILWIYKIKDVRIAPLQKLF